MSKLTKEQRIEMYVKSKVGDSKSGLSEQFGIMK